MEYIRCNNRRCKNYYHGYCFVGTEECIDKDGNCSLMESNKNLDNAEYLDDER